MLERVGGSVRQTIKADNAYERRLLSEVLHSVLPSRLLLFEANLLPWAMHCAQTADWLQEDVNRSCSERLDCSRLPGPFKQHACARAWLALLSGTCNPHLVTLSTCHMQVVPAEESGTGFGEVGALDTAKTALREAVQLPLQHPHLFARGSLARPCKGVLLFGPPGPLVLQKQHVASQAFDWSFS